MEAIRAKVSAPHARLRPSQSDPKIADAFAIKDLWIALAAISTIVQVYIAAMRSVILLIALIAFATASAKNQNSSGSRGSGEKHVKDKGFLEHWRKHRVGKGRLYNKKEVMEREQHFLDAKKRREEWNAKPDKTWEMISNKFDDFTDDELRAYVGADEEPIPEPRALPSPIYSFISNSTPLPPFLSWKIFSSSVVFQGTCGSCWAYAGTAVLEAFLRQAYYRLFVKLSPQYYVDCDRTNSNNGCIGGLAYNLFRTVQREGFTAPLLSSYPVTSPTTGVEGTCTPAGLQRTSVPFSKANIIFPRGNITQTKQLLFMYGAIGISIQVIPTCRAFFSIGPGVYSDVCGCSTDCTGINHAVVLEGYGWDLITGKQYWLIKNSYGTSWGESGYVRMEITPNNKCGVSCRNVYVEK